METTPGWGITLPLSARHGSTAANRPATPTVRRGSKPVRSAHAQASPCWPSIHNILARSQARCRRIAVPLQRALRRPPRARVTAFPASTLPRNPALAGRSSIREAASRRIQKANRPRTDSPPRPRLRSRHNPRSRRPRFPSSRNHAVPRGTARNRRAKPAEPWPTIFSFGQ